MKASSHNTIPSEALSVSQVNACAKQLLEDVFGFICVQGEVSNLVKPASGHLYFSLKDSHAQIRCALFKPYALYYQGQLENGQQVQVCGRLSLFEARGDYQLIAEQVSNQGNGALRYAFEALKLRLDAEGLFDAQRKKALPAYPQQVGIITSPDGAVLHDIQNIFQRRAPYIALKLIPTPVQGKEATQSIVQAIRWADAQALDALILARGGGSLEDLWCFNEESVARAIAACNTPLISAIGHETDVSISDWVADVRAPTPSAAAELLAPHHLELSRQLEHLKQRLVQSIQSQIQHQQQRCDILSQRLLYPAEMLVQVKQRHNSALAQRLLQAMQQQLAAHQTQLQLLAKTLHAVSPLATLERGYGMVLDGQKHLIRAHHQVKPNQALHIRLHQGSLRVRVEECLADAPSK